MDRRIFVSGLCSVAAAWPLTARAQKRREKMLRVGIVGYRDLHRSASFWIDSFKKRMVELGYLEGRNIVYDFAWMFIRSYSQDAHRQALRDLVRRKVDVIYQPVSEGRFRTAVAAVHKTPLVLASPDFDPVEGGLAPNYHGSRRNYTCVYAEQATLNAKRLQLLKDAVPGLKAVTVFWDVKSAKQWASMQAKAARLNLEAFGVEFKKVPYDFERGFAPVPAKYRGGLIVLPSSSFAVPERRRLPDFALRHRLPAIFVIRDYVVVGGLMSYGANFPAIAARAADYVDLIAKGADPGALPIAQPPKYDLAINLKTAKALGIKLPPAILLRATEVIE